MRDESLFYGALANEETNLFNHRDSWCRQDVSDGSYNEYLQPHSKPYFSRLRPLFSFEVKSIESLNQFSHVLFRDGLVFLLHFFKRFERPGKFKGRIYIHHSFCWVVPKPWQEQIGLYCVTQGRDEVMLRPTDETSDDAFLIVDLHDPTGDLKRLKLLESYCTVKIIPFLNTMKGGEDSYYERAPNIIFFEEVKKNLLRERDKRSYSLISWSELLKGDLQKISFLNFNEGGLFYADSSLSHKLLSAGARSLGGECLKRGDFISLSPYHGMKIFSFMREREEEELHHLLYDELKYPFGGGHLERGDYSPRLLSLAKFLMKKKEIL